MWLNLRESYRVRVGLFACRCCPLLETLSQWRQRGEKPVVVDVFFYYTHVITSRFPSKVLGQNWCGHRRSCLLCRHNDNTQLVMKRSSSLCQTGWTLRRCCWWLLRLKRISSTTAEPRPSLLSSVTSLGTFSDFKPKKKAPKQTVLEAQKSRTCVQIQAGTGPPDWTRFREAGKRPFGHAWDEGDARFISPSSYFFYLHCILEKDVQRCTDGTLKPFDGPK